MRDKFLAPHRFRQGRALHSRDKIVEAIAEYEAALALDPVHVESLHYLGVALHQRGETEKGLVHIRRALEIDANDLGALTNCGELCRTARMPLEAEVHLNLAIALHPSAIEARINLAGLYLDQGRGDEAREVLRQARELHPVGTALMRRLWSAANESGHAAGAPKERAHVLWVTGRELLRRNRPTLALPFLRDAVALDSDAPARWLSLGIAHYERDDKPQAIAAFLKAAACDPTLAIIHTNLANAYMQMGDEAAAARYYDLAVARAPEDTLACFNRGLLELKQGRWPEAWALYDQRHRLPNARQWPGERWDGSPIEGKRLLVHCEQGIGDTLQFARFIAPLRGRGAHITLAAQKSLSRLCQRVEGVDEFLLEGRVPEFDVRIELLSLPHILGTTPASLPAPARGLMVPTDHPVAAKAARLDGKKIGLCWAGSPAHPNDWRRSVPLGLLSPLKDVQGVQFVSLQKGPRAADIAAEGWSGRIHDWTAELEDFADTAALIQPLDLVVTVDTAIAHLAATLGKPTWIILPEPGEWRWGEEAETTIWYPTARLFRQRHPYAWKQVVERLGEALGRIVGGA